MSLSKYHWEDISGKEIQINKRRIALAIDALCQVYIVKESELLNTSYRKKPVPDARRMLIHYMHNQLGIRHFHIQHYINSISHATSIYHCNKFDVYLRVESQTRHRYLLFRKMAGEFDDRLLELQIRQDELESMRQEVEDILKEINGDNTGN